MGKPVQESDTYNEAETSARREAALKRMLATQHKPHSEQVKRPGSRRAKRALSDN